MRKKKRRPGNARIGECMGGKRQVDRNDGDDSVDPFPGLKENECMLSLRGKDLRQPVPPTPANIQGSDHFPTTHLHSYHTGYSGRHAGAGKSCR